jgi:hypothetical protein
MNPAQIDPSKLAAAKAAYQADLAANQPQLIDGQGRSHAADPFDVADDGSVSFNRWTANGNTVRNAQDAFFDDTETGPDGKTTTVRRAAWQSVPEYYNDESRNQFDYISTALDQLQGKGLKNMRKIFKKSLSKLG